VKSKKIAVVLFCVASSVLMSSCMKKELKMVASPIVTVAKVVGGCAKVVFDAFRIRHGEKNKPPHTHTKRVSRLDAFGEVQEIV